jgi:hypothetical protein
MSDAIGPIYCCMCGSQLDEHGKCAHGGRCHYEGDAIFCSGCGGAFGDRRPFSGANSGPACTNEIYFATCSDPKCMVAMMKTFATIAKLYEALPPEEKAKHEAERARLLRGTVLGDGSLLN